MKGRVFKGEYPTLREAMQVMLRQLVKCGCETCQPTHAFWLFVIAAVAGNHDSLVEQVTNLWQPLAPPPDLLLDLTPLTRLLICFPLSSPEVKYMTMSWRVSLREFLIGECHSNVFRFKKMRTPQGAVMAAEAKQAVTDFTNRYARPTLVDVVNAEREMIDRASQFLFHPVYCDLPLVEAVARIAKMRSDFTEFRTAVNDCCQQLYQFYVEDDNGPLIF